MKSLLIRISVALALAASAISCTLEIQGDTSAASLKTISSFTASVGDEACTKLRIDDSGHLSWSFSESIGVYSDTDPVQVFYKYGENNVFEGSTPVSGNEFFAYYPYSEITVDPENTHHLQYSNSYARITDLGQDFQLPLTARATSSTLSFKHAAGVLHISFKGTKVLQQIRLFGNNDEMIWGDKDNLFIDMEQDPPVLKFKEYQAGHNSIFVWIDKQLEKDQPYDLYFVLPPMTFEKGLSVWLSYDNQYNTKATTKKIEIRRGEVKHLSVVDLDAFIGGTGDENTPEEEREALIAFYNALDGPHWKNNTNWCSDQPVGTWYGVLTDWLSGHVSILNFEHNRLKGAIPNEISKLSNVNDIAIVEAEGKITNFEALYNITSLEKLYLGIGGYMADYDAVKDNMIALPAGISKLENLQRLHLYGINADLPEDLFDMENLQYLSLMHLDTGRPLQSGLGRLKNLKELNITGVPCPGSKTVCGELPDDIFDLHNLEQLAIQGTEIGGALSPRIGELQKLRYLDLTDNRLSGPIPAELSRLHLIDNATSNNGMYYMELTSNDFSGKIPEAFRYWPEWQKSWGYIVNGNDKLEYSELAPTIPDFQVTTLDGGIFSSSSVKDNELTVLAQWESWCPFSSMMVPELKELYAAYKDKGLALVSYSPEEESVVREHASSNAYPWPTFCNATKDGSAPMGIEYYPYRLLPTITVFDNSGRMVFVQFGLSDELTSFIESRLGPSGAPYESADFSADGTVHTLQAAARGAGIDVVLMGDAYSDRLIADGTYGKVMQRAADALFSEEPYKSFRDCFNVYYVDVVSRNEKYSGQTALATWFGEGTAVGGDNTKVLEYVQKAIPADRIDDALVIVAINRDFYAGTCYLYPVAGDTCDYGRGASISYFPASSVESTFVGTVSHEAGGHGFAKLADEYFYMSNGTIPQELVEKYRTEAQPGWWPNADFTSDPSSVKWSEFIADSRFAGEGLGVYQGAFTYYNGAYRPTRNSIMNNNTGGYNAPSRYAIWYRINKLAFGAGWNGTYEDFVAYDAVNRTPVAAAARRAAARRSAWDKDFTPLAPPVVIEGGWRQ